MQKSVVIAILLVLLCPVAAFAAPDRTGKWDVGVNISGAFPDDNDSEAAVYVGGNFSYGILPWLAVGGEVGGAEFDEEDDTRAFGFSDLGTLNGVPILADAIFRVNLPDQPIVPYGVVGLGLVVWNFDESSQLAARGVSLNVDTSFAAKIGGGFDWFLNEHWAANFEGGYLLSDADAEVSLNGVPVATANGVDTDVWFIGGGAKYLFS